MSEARSKLDILYGSVLGDIDKIITRIETLNTNSMSIKTTIEKFNNIEKGADKKLDEINTITKRFNKNSYIALAGTFMITALIGLGVGYYTFYGTLQSVVFETQLKKVADLRLQFEQDNQFMMLAKRKGLVFYPNAVVLPINNIRELGLSAGDDQVKAGNILYVYPK